MHCTHSAPDWALPKTSTRPRGGGSTSLPQHVFYSNNKMACKPWDPSGLSGWLDESAVATGRGQESVKISDTGHGGVRAGRCTAEQKHSTAEEKEPESVWVVTSGVPGVCDGEFKCVFNKHRERKTERCLQGSTWYSINKTLRLMISRWHQLLFHFLTSRGEAAGHLHGAVNHKSVLQKVSP